MKECNEYRVIYERVNINFDQVYIDPTKLNVHERMKQMKKNYEQVQTSRTADPVISNNNHPVIGLNK